MATWEPTMTKLDLEERKILEYLESGRLESVEDRAEVLARHRAIAKGIFNKDARINIRQACRDLRALQARALREGIPYQTLIASVLHKYVDGQLVDKN